MTFEVRVQCALTEKDADDPSAIMERLVADTYIRDTCLVSTSNGVLSVRTDINAQGLWPSTEVTKFRAAIAAVEAAKKGASDAKV